MEDGSGEDGDPSKSRLYITKSKKLKNESIPFRKAAFGPRRNIEPTVISVPERDNLLAARDFPPGSFKDRIALIRRGEVNFSLKIYRAQKAGARGVLIANNEPDLRASMGAGDLANLVGIPSLLIPQEIGEILLKEVRKAGRKTKIRAEFVFTPSDFIYGAVASGDVTEVMRLIDSGTGINSDIVDDMPFRCSFLTTSSQNGHYNLVKALLERGADVNQPDNRGSSPLSIASNAGHTRVVELLIEWKADVHNSCPGGRFRPIESAFDQGHTEVVEKLWNAMDKTDVRRCVFSAVVIGKLDYAREILEAGSLQPNDTIEDQYGYTFLTKAARQGHAELCALILDHAADINRNLPKTGRSALWLAAEQAKLNVCRLLIVRKCNINQTTVNGGSALSIAAGGGYMEIVRELVENKADITNKQGRFRPIESAALAGHNDVAQYLWKCADKTDRIEALFNAVVVGDWDHVSRGLKSGIPVNQQNSEGFTMLTKAALLGQVALVKELVRAKASVNDTTASNGRAPLWLAAEQNKVDVVKELLKLKADVNMNTRDGGSALSIAAGNGNLVVTKLLLKYKADIHNSAGKFRPIESAQIYNHDEVTQLLWNRMDKRDAKRTLHYACVVGNLPMVKEILETSGMDINDTIDTDGYTLLTKAAFIGHQHISKHLINLGADVNQPTEDDKTSALWLSAERNNREILKLLIDAKADLDQVTQDGGCALSISCLEGHVETVRTLVNAGADVHNTEGKFKPIESAHNKGHQDVVKYLWDHLQSEADAHQECNIHSVRMLRYAVACGLVDTVESLVDSKCEIDSVIEDGGYTALMNSSWYGHVDMVASLVSLNADVFRKNEKNNTALTIAYQRKQKNIVNFLRSHILDLQMTGTDVCAGSPRVDGVYYLCRIGDKKVMPSDHPQLLTFFQLPASGARNMEVPNNSEVRPERNLVCWRRTSGHTPATHSGMRVSNIAKAFYDVHALCGESGTLRAGRPIQAGEWVNSFGQWTIDSRSKLVTARAVLQGAEADQDILFQFQATDDGTSLTSNCTSGGKMREPWYYYFLPITKNTFQNEVTMRRNAVLGLEQVNQFIPPPIVETIAAFVAGRSRWNELPMFEHFKRRKPKAPPKPTENTGIG